MCTERSGFHRIESLLVGRHESLLIVMLSTLYRTAYSQARQKSLLLSRAMSSTSSAKLPKFFVWAPDSTTEGTLARRYEVRGQHLETIQPLIDAGVLRALFLCCLSCVSVLMFDYAEVGGMLVDPDATESEGTTKQAVGSLLIFQAETLSDVKKMVESDIYYTSGVVSNSEITVSSVR